MTKLSRRGLLATGAAGAAVAAVGLSVGSLNANAATYSQPVPASIKARYGLDTTYYGKYLRAGNVDVLAHKDVSEETFRLVRNRLNVIIQTAPVNAANELNKRKVRLAIAPRSHRWLAAIPEVRKAYGTSRNYANAVGPTDAVPVAAMLELSIGPNQEPADGDLVAGEISHMVHVMALRHIDSLFTSELNTAWNQAKASGRWNGTAAMDHIESYFREVSQSYFNVNSRSRSNRIWNRMALQSADPAGYQLLHRIYRGAAFPIE